MSGAWGHRRDKRSSLACVRPLPALPHQEGQRAGKPQRDRLRQVLQDLAGEPSKTIVTYSTITHSTAGVSCKWTTPRRSGRADMVCFGHDHESASWRDYLGIDWVLASGKSTDENRRGQFTCTEVTIYAKDQHNIGTVSFKRAR